MARKRCSSCRTFLTEANWAKCDRGKKRKCISCKREYQRAYRKRPGVMRALNELQCSRWGSLKYRANKTGIPCDITREAYAALLLKPCHYCGGALNTASVGLDQVVSGKGYTKDNVVPCCEVCNIAKSNIFTESEMLCVLGPAVALIRRKREQDGQSAPARTCRSPRTGKLRNGGETAKAE